MLARRQFLVWTSVIITLCLVLFNKLNNAPAKQTDPINFETILTHETNFITPENPPPQIEKIEELPPIKTQKITETTPLLTIKTHSVRSGESLWTIAKRNGIDTFTLLSFNKLKNGHIIREGQILKIPNRRGLLHTVRKDETLEEIAIFYRTELGSIIEINEISDPDQIFVGEDLFVPNAKINESYRLKLLPKKFGFILPSSGPIGSGFGYRTHPILKRRMLHKGIDFGAKHGSIVRAAASGRVTFSGKMGTYGNLVVIDHRNGFETRYAHNSKLFAKKGQTVKRGQKIALVGNTGRSTGPHLHFEIRKNGIAIDPKKYLK